MFPSSYEYSVVLISFSKDQLVGDMAKLKVKAFGQRKKEENTDAKINHEIEKLENENNEIYRASSEQQGDLQARL